MWYDDEGVWHCRGSGVDVTANSQRGAYTNWKNALALHEMSPEQREKILKRRIIAPPFGMPMVVGGQ